MNEDIFLLDVNIPMYAAGKDHPYREACIRVMSEVAEGRLAAAIDTEVIQVISTDDHFDCIEGVTRYDPAAWVGRQNV